MSVDYLILGGTGSLGQKLIDRLLPVASVAVYSRDEAKQWTIRNDLSCGRLASRAREALSFYVGDVRDVKRMRMVIRQLEPRVVIFAAALKQVDTCETTPFESVQTNLLGVNNAVEIVAEGIGAVEKLLLVSTDKSCAPVNVYGMCKAVAERLVTSQSRHGGRTKFLAVRYGNVLESRGSIIPLFRHQAANAEALTVTDPNMTRFVMTLDQSVDLIQHALTVGTTGDTWIPCLPAMRVGDLADLFSERAGKPIKVVGLRPGEKMHEDLVNESESSRSARMKDHYVISPAYLPGNGPRFTYSSGDAEGVLSRDALEKTLVGYGIFDMPLDGFKGPRIEEIRTGRV